MEKAIAAKQLDSTARHWVSSLQGLWADELEKARMHRLQFRFVLSVDSFGGTNEVAEKKIATTQILAESRRIEDKDSIFISFNSVVAFPCVCVCRKWG